VRNKQILVHSCSFLCMLHEQLNYIGEKDVPNYCEQDKVAYLLASEGQKHPCRCKLRVTYEEAREWVSFGEACWKLELSTHRDHVVESADAIVLLQVAKTPRTQTFEKANTERLVEGHQEDIDKANAYGDMQIDVWDTLTRKEPWSEADDPFRGRAIIVLFDYDLRTMYSGSIK
jgi:hypothetical protein